jgi:phosphinothricin acetyltransferase
MEWMTMTIPLIRSATLDDAPALLQIYRPFIENTAVSFEMQVPSINEFASRIDNSLKGWAWLVAEVDGQIAGYAYGGSHRERAAYRWSVETSVYLHHAFHRHGIASALYAELLDMLTEKGYCNAYAGATLPNDASIGFHRSLGFEWIGVFKRVGWKFGQWHDVAWMHRVLRDTPIT